MIRNVAWSMTGVLGAVVIGCSGGGGEPETYAWPSVHFQEEYTGDGRDTIEALVSVGRYAGGGDHELVSIDMYAIEDGIHRDRLRSDLEAVLQGWERIADGDDDTRWERGRQRIILRFVELEGREVAVYAKAQRP